MTFILRQLLTEAIEIIDGERRIVFECESTADGSIPDYDARNQIAQWDDWLRRAREAVT
jgi:hypothetical protein